MDNKKKRARGEEGRGGGGRAHFSTGAWRRDDIDFLISYLAYRYDIYVVKVG